MKFAFGEAIKDTEGTAFAGDTPLTDDELEAAAEAIREQREAIRQDLEAVGVDITDWTAVKPDAEPEPDCDAADSD